MMSSITVLERTEMECVVSVRKGRGRPLQRWTKDTENIFGMRVHEEGVLATSQVFEVDCDECNVPQVTYNMKRSCAKSEDWCMYLITNILYEQAYHRFFIDSKRNNIEKQNNAHVS